MTVDVESLSEWRGDQPASIGYVGNGIGDDEAKPSCNRNNSGFAVPFALMWDSPRIELQI
jgi:hypothetical protein